MSSNLIAFDEALHLPFYDPEPVDQLRSLLGDEMVVDLVAEYESSGVETLARLDQAIAAGDATSAQREVHSLKSASASLGLTRLSRLCFALESDCHAGSLDLVRRKRDVIGENYQEACKFLQKLKAS